MIFYCLVLTGFKLKYVDPLISRLNGVGSSKCWCLPPIIFATTQPTTQNNLKQLLLGGIIISKKKTPQHHHLPGYHYN